MHIFSLYGSPRPVSRDSVKPNSSKRTLKFAAVAFVSTDSDLFDSRLDEVIRWPTTLPLHLAVRWRLARLSKSGNTRSKWSDSLAKVRHRIAVILAVAPAPRHYDAGSFRPKTDEIPSFPGGFAHVYLATSEHAIPVGSPSATRQHVLKRIAVPDKAGVADVGKEVEVMVSLIFLLRSSDLSYHILTLFDRRNCCGIIRGSSILSKHHFLRSLRRPEQARRTRYTSSWNGVPVSRIVEGFDRSLTRVAVAGGGIIDMMNTRLQNRMTESEILKIFSDVVEVCRVILRTAAH